ncbi:MAG: ABC transporter permease [Longimonas sp.]|uniref:FtsX-like permease family protein n=1 Tax=Longimonas sp. TaxID=2039626 RepID=UPI00335415A8
MDYRLQIATRYLFSQKRVSLISIITGLSTVGVALGVAALIVVLSVMNGFFDFVRDLMVSLDPHVRIESTEAPGLAEAADLERLALQYDDVASASAFVEGRAVLMQREGTGPVRTVVTVRGVAPEATNEMRDAMRYGQFDIASDITGDSRAGIVLNTELGRSRGLMPQEGDDAPVVGLISAAGIEQSLTSVFSVPRLHWFGVRGLFDMQAVQDENRVYIGVSEAQRLFRLGDRVSGIDIRLHDIERADALKAQLERDLDADAFTVRTWYDMQRALFDVMQLEKWGAWAILFLIVIVAAFNIVGSLTMVVIEKRRDVGVLRALGVSARNIRRIFLLEGALIGAVGTGMGAGLGLGLALAQKHFALVPLSQAESFLIDAYPVVIQTADVLAVVGLAFGLCVVAALYPAARAASVAPAQSIQGDM